MIDDATDAAANPPLARAGANKRPTLAMPKVAALPRSDETPNTLEIIRGAIMSERRVVATYNKGTVQLAPYVLYEKREGLFVDGLVLGRNGVAPAEAKIGSFKLVGLTAATVTGAASPAHPTFDRHDPKYAGTTLLVIGR